MAITTESGAKRVMTRFEKAADAYAFRGTIPQFESEEASYAYDAVEKEYDAAKKAIENFMYHMVRML